VRTEVGERGRGKGRTVALLERLFELLCRDAGRSLAVHRLVVIIDDDVAESSRAEGEVGALAAHERALVAGGLAVDGGAVGRGAGGGGRGRSRLAVARDVAREAGRDELERGGREGRLEVEERTEVGGAVPVPAGALDRGSARVDSCMRGEQDGHGPFCCAELVAAVLRGEEPAIVDLALDVGLGGGYADGEVVEEGCTLLWTHAARHLEAVDEGGSETSDFISSLGRPSLSSSVTLASRLRLAL